MTEVLVARKLGRRYRWRGGSNQALLDVDLSVPKGVVLGLLGRNGAGKTTFVRIAATSLMPTSGSLEVFGHDVVREADAVRERIAVIPQESRPFYWMSPTELVAYYLRMRGESTGAALRQAKETLEELELTRWKDTQVNRLSGGLRRRVMVAMVMASDAEFLFLDEPTTGLDPLARRSVWAAIRKAAKANRTVLLTTHYLDEAEALSDRLAILESGRLLASGTPREIAARVRHPYRVTLEGGFSEKELRALGQVTQVGAKTLLFTGEQEARELARVSLEKGTRISMGPVSLEDLFVQIVGKEISEEDEEVEASHAA
ncbi:MAG: ABC transporter ATP-binding protein [Euryarchaeota archaeon]|nr:ABC transporter ATP-binding protein [Euryarchaeota archaeon]MDE1836130.1 ABC transporter ATP-binding protein [Euryarchaeota archaeon]MDE1879420.1 ABC transporter ATP-binding protein [Euryarchaeota archaeon]MDE2044108.1 ABC transporter ATP-binding protein [Thermoplasmata archaeon]